jgi:hypothetical protein
VPNPDVAGAIRKKDKPPEGGFSIKTRDLRSGGHLLVSLFDRNANYPRANHAEFASSAQRHVDDPAPIENVSMDARRSPSGRMVQAYAAIGRRRHGPLYCGRANGALRFVLTIDYGPSLPPTEIITEALIDPILTSWGASERLPLYASRPLSPGPRNICYQASGATPYSDRSSTGWIAPACGWRTYSITSSARVSTIAGTSRPSALAVLRLSTVSYLVGACTGRSTGFSPLRMRST